MKRQTWAEVSDELDRFLIVDVRTPEAFSRGSLPGAVSLPLERLARGDYRLEADRPLLVVCDYGHKASLAALYLEADGFRVSVLEGGLAAIPDSVRKPLNISL